MTQPHIDPTIAARGLEEQIDVLQIRLWNTKNAMAMLREFHSAERVLATWGSSHAGNPVTFEVTFADGHVLRGSYEFFCKGKRKCLFTTHVRRLLAQGEAPVASAAGLSRTARPRYLVPGWTEA